MFRPSSKGPPLLAGCEGSPRHPKRQFLPDKGRQNRQGLQKRLYILAGNVDYRIAFGGVSRTPAEQGEDGCRTTDPKCPFGLNSKCSSSGRAGPGGGGVKHWRTLV